MTNAYEWDLSDRYTDSSGLLLAKITSWTDGVVHLVRWRAKDGENGSDRSRPVSFTLSEKFWMSPACGWRLRRAKEAK